MSRALVGALEWVAAGRVGAKHPIDWSAILAKVLVADDERNVRMSLVYILVDAGYDVIEAEDGPKALDKAYEELPDLILLDVMMPGMDGFQVLKKSGKIRPWRLLQWLC